MPEPILQRDEVAKKAAEQFGLLASSGTDSIKCYC